MWASISLAKAAEGICRWTEKEAENRSQDWPRFDGKVLGYPVWKKEWILLGPPGCAQVFPYLSPGPLDLWWYANNE